MTAEQMQCPECGEDAVNTPPTDPVPWATHGLTQPQWSHHDGSSLCPVLGDSGYMPAQPQPRAAESQPGREVSRLDPPERLRPEERALAQDGPSGPSAEAGPKRAEIGVTAEGRDAQAVTTDAPATRTSAPKTGKTAAAATQVVLDAINSGQLSAGQLEDCDFWAAKAAEQRTHAEAEADPGPPERQPEDWSIRRDHGDGLTADYDLDREA